MTTLPPRGRGRPKGATKGAPSVSERADLKIGVYPDDEMRLLDLCEKHKACKSGVIREAIRRMHEDEEDD